MTLTSSADPIYGEGIVLTIGAGPNLSRGTMATACHDQQTARMRSRPRSPGRGDTSNRLFPRLGLFWQVFGLNAGLVILGVVLLAATPATISDPITLAQGLMLIVSCVVALIANAWLLRRSLRPLRELEQVMGNVDLLRPGQRSGVHRGARELVVLAEAFDGMLGRLEGERRTSAARSLESHEAERRVIATDLHDEVGQSLTALLLLLRPMIEEAPPDLAPGLRETQRVLRATLDEVRRIARQLRPAALEDLGLEPGLRALCGVIEQSVGATIVQTYDPELNALPADVELALYRTAQEALTNVARHAHASSASLTLARSNGTVRLSITDDGRGMVYADGAESGGIRGMRERAVSVGGKVSVESLPGHGTTVTLTIPVASAP
jgi:two-component system, NarL family, sensor histidine kinase UhpB